MFVCLVREIFYLISFAYSIYEILSRLLLDCHLFKA